MTTLGAVMRRRILGLVFIIGLATLMALSVASYLKVFTPVLWVTLKADHTGLQLNNYADVKVRGALVGEVREINSAGEQAVLRLALDPALVHHVPSNVTARLLPKTLFGEKYVSLVPPENPSPEPISDGAVITEDRSETAIELEQALNNLLPLLKAVQPEKLAATLAAIARGLEGRGEQLGENLVATGEYLAELNDEMPTIQEDIRRLANVLDTYDKAMPDLLEMLRNLTVTSSTVNEQRAQLRSALVATADLGDHSRFFLDRYGARLIQLGEVSAPVMRVIARYSPEFPCLAKGLVRGEKFTGETFSTGRLHVLVEVTEHQGRYEKGVDDPPEPEEASQIGEVGPRCYGLPHPDVPFSASPPDGTGYDWGHSRSHTPEPPFGPQGRALEDSLLVDPTMGYAGSEEEKAIIKPIVAAATGTPVTEVGDLAVMLWGPLMRGAVVNAR